MSLRFFYRYGSFILLAPPLFPPRSSLFANKPTPLQYQEEGEEREGEERKHYRECAWISRGNKQSKRHRRQEKEEEEEEEEKELLAMPAS